MKANPLVGTPVIQDTARSGQENMARDAALLEMADQLGVCSIRLYEWDGPWVSLGRNQTPEAALRNPDAVPWVIRPTGGSAVLHGHDLTVAIAAPLQVLSVGRRSPMEAYQSIAGIFEAAFASLGQSVGMQGPGSPLHSPPKSDCFLVAAPNDIVDIKTGAKVVGCALRVTKTAVLAQCSIPVSLPLFDPADVFEEPHTPVPLSVTTQDLREAFRRTLAPGTGH